MTTPGKRALYDILNQDAGLAIEIDRAIQASAQDGWRGSRHKHRKVQIAIQSALGDESDEAQVERILALVSRHVEY
jgi:type I restriction enzyme R subunit